MAEMIHKIQVFTKTIEPKISVRPMAPSVESFASACDGFVAALIHLAAKIRDYAPDVIILVARKMPRLAELRGLDFGQGVIVISDLAIPFAHVFLRGARVAIVDDVVNVGTTIGRAEEMVLACGAKEVRLFAAGHRTLNNGASESVTDRIDFDEELSAEAYSEIVNSVPQSLHSLAKPYDLEFPLIPCKLNAPFSTAKALIDWLRGRFGDYRVHELTPGDGINNIRVTVDIDCGPQGMKKIRFYFLLHFRRKSYRSSDSRFHCETRR